MDKPIETIEYKGFKIDIFPDIDPINPREWDNLGTMLCKHRRYDLGDSKESKAMNAEDIRAYVARNDVISLSLYLYDHSGLYLQCSSNGNPFMGRLSQGHAELDSGLVGWITLSYEKARKEYGVKRITKAFKSRMEKYLVNEVEAYAQYLSGDVYGYNIDGVGDSCWGFYGSDWEKNGLLENARDAIDYHITSEIKKQEHAALFEPVTNA